MNYDLVGIGNALVDIEVQVDDAFIEKTSVTKGGMTLSSIEDQNNILESLKSSPKKISSGGSAANTIHGASLLGAKSYYLGRVANDSHGKHYTEDMQNCGVGFSGPGSDEQGTGTCVVLITPDTERTMLTHLGVSSSLHPENVDETIVKNSRGVYVEGYLWTGDGTREAGQHMAGIAKKEGIPVSFTLSDAFVVNSFKESLIEFIDSYVDIGIPTVVILISGRPMIITDELNKTDAFVVGWLPGSEGDGFAEVLFGDYNFTGKLPHSWPANLNQYEGKYGPNYWNIDANPLFQFGYGLAY